MKLKSIEAFVVLNMNGFDKVTCCPSTAPRPAFLETPTLGISASLLF